MGEERQLSCQKRRLENWPNKWRAECEENDCGHEPLPVVSTRTWAS